MKKKELIIVEVFMRLDVVVLVGFGMFCSKMVDLIDGGDVRVNWKEIS